MEVVEQGDRDCPPKGLKVDGGVMDGAGSSPEERKGGGEILVEEEVDCFNPELSERYLNLARELGVPVVEGSGSELELTWREYANENCSLEEALAVLMRTWVVAMRAEGEDAEGRIEGMVRALKKKGKEDAATRLRSAFEDALKSTLPLEPKPDADSNLKVEVGGTPAGWKAAAALWPSDNFDYPTPPVIDLAEWGSDDSNPETEDPMELEPSSLHSMVLVPSVQEGVVEEILNDNKNKITASLHD